jgi:large-conductance mechanosensitive channel
MSGFRLLVSSKGVIDMGVGMLLAAALYHFVAVLVMSAIMPFLDSVFPGMITMPMTPAQQHPLVMTIYWGNLTQASIVLISCILIAALVLRLTAGATPTSHSH